MDIVEKRKLIEPYLSKTGRLMKQKAEKFLKKYESIIDFIEDKNLPASALIYCWIHNTTPLCKICSAKNCSFCGFNDGFLNTCSSTCAAEDPVRKEKTKNSILEKYNGRHYMYDAAIKKKVAATVLEKYGVDNILKRRDLVLDGLKKKYGVHIENIGQTDHWLNSTEKTMNEKYGGRGTAGSVGIQIRKTNISKYGFENPMQSNEVSQKTRNAQAVNNLTRILLNKNLKNDLGFHNYDHGSSLLQISCIKCNRSFEYCYGKKQLRCYKCFPNNRSTLEVLLFNFLVDDLKIPEHDIMINSRSILPSKKELDIYIPKYKLAIEINGLYHHSSSNVIDDAVSELRHLNKLKECDLLGIRLLNIFEHEFENKPEIIKSIIKTAVKAQINIIPARKTVIKEISFKEIKQFLNVNHLKGSISAKTYYGMFFKNELVGCLTIGISRFNKNEMEIIRSCFKLGCVVIGGYDKLLKYCIKNLQSEQKLITYIDRNLFTGNSLLIHAETISETPPSYWYWKRKTGIMLSRYQAQKHKLKKILGDDYDSTKTEVQNMYDNKWLRFWDCGSLKIIFKPYK